MSTLANIETLRIIWWTLLGVLLIGFAIMDGWDLGVGALLPFVARTDVERRITINAVGATWEGNQVWFILGGGAIFAAWPFVYAVSFSGFYLAMFLVLAALILRPVAFKYRSKRPGRAWRASWDWALFVGGFVPSLVFGVAVGNVLQGVPFRFNDDLRVFYDGTLWGLFTPFTVLCGLLSVSMLTLQGAAYLTVKIEQGRVHERARTYGTIAGFLSLALYWLGFAFIDRGNMGYRIVGAADPTGVSNPLRTLTEHVAGGWLANYADHPWTVAAPVLATAGAMLALIGLRQRAGAASLGGSAISIFGIIASVGLSMFPIILPSSIDAHSTLTVWNASSTAPTLFTMLIVTAVFLPLILLYTAWVYRVLWGRITTGAIALDHDLY